MHGSAKKHRYPLRLPDEYAWLGGKNTTIRCACRTNMHGWGKKHRYPLRLPDEYAWLGGKTPALFVLLLF